MESKVNQDNMKHKGRALKLLFYAKVNLDNLKYKDKGCGSFVFLMIRLDGLKPFPLLRLHLFMISFI